MHVFPSPERGIRKYCKRDREKKRMVNLSDSDRFRALFSCMDGSILQARDGQVRLAAGGLHIIAFFHIFCSFFFFCHRLVLWLSLLVDCFPVSKLLLHLPMFY